MTTTSRRRHPATPTAARVVVGAALALGMLVGCAPTDGDHANAGTPTPADEHDGDDAREVGSPARALVVGDRDGTLTLLDLATEERSPLADGSAQILPATGRFVHRVRERAGAVTVEIIDTGRWSVPHGDHAHSFVAEPRTVASVDGDAVTALQVGDRQTALTFADGRRHLLGHENLDGDGDRHPHDVVVTAEPHAIAVPFAGHMLVADSAGIEIRDERDATLGHPIPCPDATDADFTRVGAVITCADGAVLVTRDGDSVLAEHVAAAVPTPQSLAGRADRPDLAGLDAAGQAWLLDTRSRDWSALAAEHPLVAVTALGDDASRAIAVDRQGRVCVIGAEKSSAACTEPLLADTVDDPARRAHLHLTVDARYAYVNDPATGAVYELDHRDTPRLTRTFTGLDPWYLQQVG